jgi:hypothetical protein
MRHDLLHSTFTYITIQKLVQIKKCSNKIPKVSHAKLFKLNVDPFKLMSFVTSSSDSLPQFPSQNYLHMHKFLQKSIGIRGVNY